MEGKSESGLIGSTIKLMSPKKSMILAFTGSAILGTLIAGRGFPPINDTLLVILSSLFITIAAYVYNDIIDLDMDKESKSSNKEDRALVTGEVSLKTAKTIVALSSILGVVIAYFINFTVFWVTLLWYSLFMMYSYPGIRLKRVFVVKTLVTAGGTALALLIGTSSVFGGINNLGLFLAFIQWTFISMMLPGLSDSFDLEEDQKYGMRTLAMVLSWKTKVRMTIFGTFFMSVMFIIAHYVFNLSIILPVLSIISSVYYLKAISTIYNEFEVEKVWKVRKIGFAYYYTNLVFVIISTMNLSSLVPFL